MFFKGCFEPTMFSSKNRNVILALRSLVFSTSNHLKNGCITRNFINGRQVCPMRTFVDRQETLSQMMGSLNSCSNLMLNQKAIWCEQKRWKKFSKKMKKSGSGKQQETEDDDENDDEDDDDYDENIDNDKDASEDSRVCDTTVISARLDAFGKTCFGMTRAKFENCFYEGLIRVNGERVGKKSIEIKTNDEIDFIRGFNQNQHELLDINRVSILKMDDKAASSGRIRIQYRKTNNMTISNYENDPYDGELINIIH